MALVFSAKVDRRRRLARRRSFKLHTRFQAFPETFPEFERILYFERPVIALIGRTDRQLVMGK